MRILNFTAAGLLLALVAGDRPVVDAQQNTAIDPSIYAGMKWRSID